MPEREIDDVDAEEVLENSGEPEGADHGAGPAGAVLVENPERDQANAWSDSFGGRRPGGGAAGDGAGDVRAMAAFVFGPGPAWVAVAEVDGRDDPAAQLGNRRDAGIDHRDADTTAGEIL